VLTPSTDPSLLAGYRCGQSLAVVAAIAFALKYGVIVAGIGLAVALAAFRIFFAIVRGIIFPAIEGLSRAISGSR
jgi:hypothetical protein